MSRFAQLAQTSYNYNYTTTSTSPSSILKIYALFLPLFILEIVGMWKTFTKAGRPGWASIIPVYNYWVLFEIAGKPGWWAILTFIPIVNIVFLIIASVEIAKRFGKSGGFALLLIFFPYIGFPILGFGSAVYHNEAEQGYAPTGSYGPTPPAPQI
jgi:hypothetical protein